MNEYMILEDLIQKISLGDKDSLGKLYDITSRDVFGYSFSLVCNKAVAEDIMQEVYMNIFNQAGSYKPRGKPMAWILRITRNMSYNILKKQKRELFYTDNQFDDQKENSFDDSEIIDKLIINEMINKLSAKERQIITLHLLSGISQVDIAKITGIPLPTVKWRYKSSLKKLAKIANY